jgi:hypothetical protein
MGGLDQENLVPGQPRQKAVLETPISMDKKLRVVECLLTQLLQEA